MIASEGRGKDTQTTSRDDNQDEHKKLTPLEILDRMESEYREAYNDQIEIANYNQDGSYFYGMSKSQVLRKITKEALSHGLAPELTLEFIKGSNIWTILSKKQQKDLLTAFIPSGIYFPGPIHITIALTKRYHFQTIMEVGTDKEQIYGFNGQVYERFEEYIKQDAHREYIAQWEAMAERTAEEESGKSLLVRLREALDRGPSVNDINEVMAMIRRTTFTKEEMNPPDYIPFGNGLLNLETRRLEPFSPKQFYTYQVNANYLQHYVTLRDTPLFFKHLNSTFYETDVPMVLSYQAYSLYPSFPRHKTLLIVGPPRVGKGVYARLTQGLMPKGSGSFSLERLLTAERFYFQNIEGKNLLIDGDTSRTFRRGIKLNWGRFTKLFGGDMLDYEDKGKTSRDYISKSKGIIIFNLPFLGIKDPPAITRFLLVQTRNETPLVTIMDLEKEILEAERDKIATLLVQVLFKLMDRNFMFPGELTVESTTDLLDKLADPVEYFIDETIEDVDGAQIKVEDVFKRFEKWCASKGVTVLKRQSFVMKFGNVYPKKRLGPKVDRDYYFLGCDFSRDETPGSLLSWTQNESQENPRIPISGMRYRSVQHERMTETLREKKNITYTHEDKIHKLDTRQRDIRNPENRTLLEIGTVSSLKRDRSSGNSDYMVRICTQNPGTLNPLIKLKKGVTFRIRKDEINDYKFYEFSREPEKGEVLESPDNIHFLEAFRAAEIEDSHKRIMQILLLVLGEKPAKSIVNLQRRISDLEPDLSLAEIDAVLKELIAMGLIRKSEDGTYTPSKEAAE